jgi:hypothetical protein
MSDPKNEAAIEDDIEVVIDGEDEQPEPKAEAEEEDEPEADERGGTDGADDPDADAAGDSEEVKAAKEARRRRRTNRKERERAEKQRLQEEIARLKAQVEQFAPLAEKVTEFEQFRTSAQTERQAQEKAYHEDQIRRAQNTYQQAVETRKKAIAEGDAEAFESADANIRLAERVYAESAAAVEKLGKAPVSAPKPEPRGPSDVDIRKKVKAEAFLSEHSWYDPDLRDEDSVILKAIDDQLAREGSDPSTDAHWEELKRRAARRLPERFATVDRAKDASRAPPEMVGGSSRDRSNPTQRLTLSPERYNALLEAGKVSGPNDPALKAWAKRYAAYDRNSSAA